MEKWERWIPLDDFPTRIYNDMLLDSDEGLIIGFHDEDKQRKVIIHFDELVLCYRNRDEGSFLSKLTYLDENYPPDFYSKWPLFKVTNSEYLKWLNLESYGTYEHCEVLHFVFITPNDVVEVLSTYDPKITVKK